MKKFFYIIIVCILVFAAGCDTAVKREKAKRLNIYSHDENYVTVTGEVTRKKENYRTIIIMKSEELKKYNKNIKSECEFIIFSDFDVNLSIGDIISITTVPVYVNSDDWLPIVAIYKNGECILTFEDGKQNLIDWVNQLQAK